MKILVLCTGNSCRSQMAEGFFKHFLDNSHEIYSAGLIPTGLNPLATEVMKEIGIDISSQHSKYLGEFLDKRFDYIITVCDNAAQNCPSFPGPAERIHWPFDDPVQASGTDDEILAEFRRVRDEIGNKIRKWLETEFSVG